MVDLVILCPMLPRYTSVVAALPSTVPFVGPEAQERVRGVVFRARIGANESVFGPSPKAIAAMQLAATECWMYCDPENHDLKAAPAPGLGLSSANIVVGEGIDSLFGCTVRLFTEPGDAVVSSLGAYPTFNFHVVGYGGRLVTVPYVEDREDPASLIEAVRRGEAEACVLCQSRQSDGRLVAGRCRTSADRCRTIDTVLVFDEAYIEFAPPGTRRGSMSHGPM